MKIYWLDKLEAKIRLSDLAWNWSKGDKTAIVLNVCYQATTFLIVLGLTGLISTVLVGLALAGYSDYDGSPEGMEIVVRTLVITLWGALYLTFIRVKHLLGIMGWSAMWGIIWCIFLEGGLFIFMVGVFVIIMLFDKKYRPPKLLDESLPTPAIKGKRTSGWKGL